MFMTSVRSAVRRWEVVRRDGAIIGTVDAPTAADAMREAMAQWPTLLRRVHEFTVREVQRHERRSMGPWRAEF